MLQMLLIKSRYEFSILFNSIYPEELELKVEHSGTHATFLDLDMTVKDRMFIHKLFDNRYAFYFFEYYLSLDQNLSLDDARNNELLSRCQSLKSPSKRKDLRSSAIIR